MIQKAKHATLWALTAVGVVLVSFILLLKIGPHVEARAYPLFADVVATFVTVKEDHGDILVTGVKARNCLLVAGKVDVLVDGNHVDGKIIMLNEAGENLSVEEQRSGVGDKFVRLARFTPAGSVVKVTVYSQCHPLWLSQQELFELDISKYPAQVR